MVRPLHRPAAAAFVPRCDAGVRTRAGGPAVNWTCWRLLGTVLVVALSAVSCGDSTERATENNEQPTAAAPGAPATTQAAAPTTTTIAMLVAWIDESEPEDGPAPLTVKFTSMVRGGIPPYSYKWVFDDGS